MVAARGLRSRPAVGALLLAAVVGLVLGGAVVDTADRPPAAESDTSPPTVAGPTGETPTTPPVASATPTATTVGRSTIPPSTATLAPADAPLSGMSPWGGETVVVAVANAATPERNVTALVAETIDYWAARDERYGAYAVDFALRRDAEDPDLIVRFADEIDCEGHTAVGCAPRLNGSIRFDPPATVWVRAGFNDRRTRRVLRHEFGHVLGIKHCEPPYAVMAHARYCEPGTVPDAPGATDRPLPWPDADLAVHVSLANVAPSAENGTREQVDRAIAYVDDGAGGSLPANLSLSAAERPWAADVAIRFSDDPPCPGGGEAVCYRRSGPDYDTDGETEFYTNATVILGAEVDVAARGWYAAWALAHLLGLDDEELPPALADAGYAERRAEWWT